MQFRSAALCAFLFLIQPLQGAPHKECQPCTSSSSENTPTHPLRQSEHTRRVSLCFLRFDSHATRARTLQPAALVFVPHGLVLVRVSLSDSFSPKKSTPWTLFFKQGPVIYNLTKNHKPTGGKGMSTQQLCRSLDLVALLGWAELLTDRYRDHVENSPSSICRGTTTT